MLRSGYWGCLAAGLAVLTTASPAARAGKLGKANDRIQGSGSSSSSNSSSSSDDDDDDDDDDRSWGDDRSSSSPRSRYRGNSTSSSSDTAVAGLCLLALPWCVPYLALETGPAHAGWAYEPYPYAGGDDRGYIRRQRLELRYNPGTASADADADADADTDADEDETPASAADDLWDAGTQRWSFRPSGEASYVFDNILRTRVAARILTPSRLELDGAISFFTESIPETGGFETALLGRVGLSVRFAQESDVQFRTGANILHWNYEGEQRNGFAGSYGFDFFPGRPVVGSVELLLGGLGDAFYFEARGTLGVSLGRAEVYVGYDFIRLHEIDSGQEVDLGGPLMGVRLWL